MRVHNEATLPKWAQERLAALRTAHANECREHDRTRSALNMKRDLSWFTLPGPTFDDAGGQRRKLWLLYPDNPFPVCDLGVGDVLMVGRAPSVALPPPASAAEGR